MEGLPSRQVRWLHRQRALGRRALFCLVSRDVAEQLATRARELRAPQGLLVETALRLGLRWATPGELDRTRRERGRTAPPEGSVRSPVPR